MLTALTRSLFILFGQHFGLISMVSVLRTGISNCNVPVKALFRLSDALKCTDLSSTKPQLKSCVREQIFGRFDFSKKTTSK